MSAPIWTGAPESAFDACEDCGLPQCEPDCEDARNDAGRWSDLEADLRAAQGRTDRLERENAALAAALEQLVAIAVAPGSGVQECPAVKLAQKLLACRKDIGW